MRQRRKMWMGPRGREMWVPAPQPGDFSRISNREVDTYLNGGAGIRGSKEGHMEYTLSWRSTDTLDLLPVLDIAEGIYSVLESDLIYFVDPTILDQNVLPSSWAAPYKTGVDGVPLTVDKDGYPAYPTVLRNSTPGLRYPGRSARYSIGPNITARKLYIPIPEGMVLWFGQHGVDNGAAFGVTPVKGDVRGTTAVPAMLTTTTDQRVNHSVAASDTVSGVEIALTRRSAGSTVVSSDFAGLIVQILDPGRIPFTGGFVSGQGNSGCEFDGTPTRSPYLGGRLMATTAKLVEVGQWR